MQDKHRHPCLHSYHAGCFETVLYHLPAQAVKLDGCLVCVSLGHYFPLLQLHQSAQQHPQLVLSPAFHSLYAHCSYQLYQVDLALSKYVSVDVFQAAIWALYWASF